jgi:hypothetical protein
MVHCCYVNRSIASSGLPHIHDKAKHVLDPLFYRLEGVLFLMRPPSFLVLDVDLERGILLLEFKLEEPEMAPSAGWSLRLWLLLRLRGRDTWVNPY